MWMVLKTTEILIVSISSYSYIFVLSIPNFFFKGFNPGLMCMMMEGTEISKVVMRKDRIYAILALTFTISFLVIACVLPRFPIVFLQFRINVPPCLSYVVSFQDIKLFLSWLNKAFLETCFSFSHL